MARERVVRLVLVGALGALLWCSESVSGVAQTPASSGPSSPWAAFVEPDFPFFSSVLDARALGPGWPTDNITPRGLVLNLGHDLWACFDIDLLRVSAIWSGAGVTPVGMAQGSYHRAGEKAPEGQGRLPLIVGTPWIATGLHPGWYTTEPVVLADPRVPGPDPREPGRGPIDRGTGRFRAIRTTESGTVLEYDVDDVSVEEQVTGRFEHGRATVERRFRIARAATPLWLIVGQRPGGSIRTAVSVDGSPQATLVRRPDDVMVVRVGPAEGPIDFRVTVAPDGGRSLPASPTPVGIHVPPPARWPEAATTAASLGTGRGAYVVDRIAIPTANPWRRNVRFADIAFTGGRAMLVTFDGDVWTASGLGGDLDRIVWRRFTSGLHEPLGIAARGDDVFVFDRNGVWRLEDQDDNGEADRHALVSHVFSQTAETREFAMSLRISPDGSFVVAKGGQVGATAGRDNGSVLRISSDGSIVEKLGWGLRQPFASVDPTTGLVFASDQQGHYIPSTPLHVVRDGAYYGFIPLTLPKEQYLAPIAEPLVWIPHAVSASAAGQVWLHGARMGPLDEALVLINYFQPSLMLVRMHEREGRRQAAVTSLTRDLEFAPLAGAVNPADGQLYVTGFQIWGSEARDISGLARYRYTGEPTTLAREVVATDLGVLMRFDVALDPKTATDPANVSAERWNYRRTAAYGSPHFRLDGTRGQEVLTPASAYLSADRRSLFIGLPGMQPVMQMRVGWSLRTAAGDPFEASVYLTPHALARFDSVAEGFEAIDVDLRPRPARVAAAVAVTAEEGQRVATRAGCLACHSTDGTVTGRVGPSWQKLAGAERVLVDGSRRIADAAYLRQSILEPAAHVARGFDQSDAGMPSYAGVLTDAEIDALILYIQSLR